MIKNFLADYAAEHFEIASYQSLIATARIVGEEQCVPVLEEILREEIAMARWLEEHIPLATSESLKVVARDSSNQRSRKFSRRSKKTSNLSRLTSPSLLFTLLGVGAIGTGTTLLLRSRNKKGQRHLSQSRQNSLDQLENGEPLVVSEVNTVETIIITVDEPDIQDTGSIRGIGDDNS